MNATRLAIEAGYPQRTVLPDEMTSWEVSIPDSIDYGSPIVNTSPDHGMVKEKMFRAGLTMPSSATLKDLARMSNGEVETHYGQDISGLLATLRCPLGRTGLNGVGIFYEAGEAATSDLVAVCKEGGELWVPIVFTRGRWNTPGGFRDDSDANGLEAAVREFKEELGHEVSSEVMPVLKEVKDSDRTADNAWIAAEVYAMIAESRFKLQAGDDAEDAKWERFSNLGKMVENKQLSEAKLRYISEAVTVLGLS
jgi:8-oxo-dGTP pyrophosphatase MutT (NUDIX family)